MPYIIQVNHETQVLTVVYSGRVTLAERICAINDYLPKLPNRNDIKVMGDFRNARIDMSDEELIQLGNYICTLDESRDARIALIYRKNEFPQSLMEGIVFLHGTTIASFDSEREALDWLVNY